jgi:outer membrane immunogenic protein
MRNDVMNKLSKLAAGSVIMATAALGCASAALADGYAPKGKTVYERPTDWSGVYFGLHSGYQWSSIDGTLAGPGGAGISGPGPFSIDQSSAFGGGHIGVQHQFNNIVLGVEGNFDSMFKGEDGSTTCPNTALRCTGRVDDIWSVGGRLGWAAGHWMPYLTGGYANAGVHFNNQTTVAFPFLSTEEARTRNNGWYIGLGAEWIVSPGWTAGIEYRHYDFDSVGTRTFTTQPPQGIPVEGLRQDLTTDSISARVSWKFSREAAAPAPLK